MTEKPGARRGMSLAGQLYLTTVIVSGVVAVATSVYRLHVVPIGYQWYMLAALTFVSGSATVTLPSVPASISVSETFVFASVLLFGPAAGTVMVALDGLVISFWMAKRRPEWYRALFNMAAPAISIWCAAQLLFLIAGIPPLVEQPSTINVLLVPLVVFAIVYFGLNSSLIALAVAFETGLAAYRIWRENFLWLSLNYFSGASVALLLVVYTRDVDLRFIGVIVPLLLVLYFTFKTSMARVTDANQHLQHLNRLYLSTIETLAMAIDAKDQITHGHIRRVQTLAVGLAKRVGLNEELSIRAIEAAALLHDMGKLAVPEYILNKPGKLSPAEFEKMKLHASVGADILSAIEFPYPVVPIVRHHHENWDGSGYPQGLKGTEIPIGARILSVVDCFDALTSDRPYRPRLSTDEAIKILLERRGTMYDPLVVDTFVRVHEEIAPSGTPPGPPRQALNEIAGSTQNAAAISGTMRLDEIAAGSDEMLTLYELAQALAGQASISDTGDIIAKHLRRLVPFSVCVFYMYDADADELEARHAMGDTTSVVKGVRIAIGQRISGWVAANRQTIVNSDPSLDLGEVARCMSPRLRSCLSTPLLSDDALVGVLSLYSSSTDGFSEDHRRIAEVVARQIGHTFKRAAEFDRFDKRDALTGLPSLRHLEHLAESASTGDIACASLLLIHIVGLKQIAKQAPSMEDDVLRHVVRQSRAGLRVADILFRSGIDAFVALLNDTDRDTAALVASRIRNSIREPLDIGGEPVRIDASVTFVCAPHDGQSLRDLMASARIRNVSELGPRIH